MRAMDRLRGWAPEPSLSRFTAALQAEICLGKKRLVRSPTVP